MGAVCKMNVAKEWRILQSAPGKMAKPQNHGDLPIRTDWTDTDWTDAGRIAWNPSPQSHRPTRYHAAL